jgi:hypothetical protein
MAHPQQPEAHCQHHAASPKQYPRRAGLEKQRAVQQARFGLGATGQVLGQHMAAPGAGGAVGQVTQGLVQAKIALEGRILAARLAGPALAPLPFGAPQQLCAKLLASSYQNFNH